MSSFTQVNSLLMFHKRFCAAFRLSVPVFLLGSEQRHGSEDMFITFGSMTRRRSSELWPNSIANTILLTPDLDYKTRLWKCSSIKKIV